MNKIYIGIDPGVSGGIAMIDGNRVASYPMPETYKDLDNVFSLIIDKARNPIVCIIEKVHSSPQMGVSTSFKFGYNFGLLVGMAQGVLGNPELVTPQQWQTALNCLTGGDKKISKKKAHELFPDEKITLKTADALLLAYYGYLKHG